LVVLSHKQEYIDEIKSTKMENNTK
jgi:hypothetical protein